MHEVKGENQRPAPGGGRVAEQPLQQQIQHRQHQHPRQGSHAPPAEGIHAEQPDADGDDKLPQRRVGDLVGVDIHHIFIGRAGVIDLVKIGAVETGAALRHDVRLIQQFLRLPADGFQRDGFPVPVPDLQFPQIQLLVGSQAEIPGLEGRQFPLPPGKQHGVLLLQGADVRPVNAVIGDGHGVGAGFQPGVVQQLLHRPVLLQLQHHLASALRKMAEALRRRHVAQTAESPEGIGRHDHRQDQSVPAGHLPLPVGSAQRPLRQDQRKPIPHHRDQHQQEDRENQRTVQHICFTLPDTLYQSPPRLSTGMPPGDFTGVHNSFLTRPDGRCRIS